MKSFRERIDKNGTKKREKKMVVFLTSFNTEMEPSKDMLLILGKKERTLEIHREYEKRKILGPWGLDKLANLYKGNSEGKLQDLGFYYYWKNSLKGIKSFVKSLKDNGIIVGALSFDPQFLMDVLKEDIGLDFAVGTKLEYQNGITTGKILEKVDRYKKAEILEKKKKEFAINKVITIGRASVVHLPTFKKSDIVFGFDPAKRNVYLPKILDILHSQRIIG